MRPYCIRKDDKFMQANLTGTQPSPLALLAATCSRIGESLHESSVYTQKNLTTSPAFIGKEKIDDFTYTKSCLEGSRASVFQPLEQQRTINELQTQYLDNHEFYPPSLTSGVKIKHEENYDYNHNATEVHICPSNLITDTRAYENDSRQDFSKSCCHEPQASSTFLQARNDNALYSTSSIASEQSSCLYQPSNSSQISQRNTIQVSNNTSLPNQNKHFPWNDEQVTRSVATTVGGGEIKPSCMMYSNYDNTTSPLQHFNTSTIQQPAVINTTRESRNSLSHLPGVSEMTPRHYSPPAATNPHLYSPHGSPFQPYSSYATMIDEKPDTFALQQAYNAQHVQPPSYGQPMASNLPNTHSPIQPTPMSMVPHGMPSGMTNAPIEGPPTFANAYHPHMMGPGMHANTPMPPNMGEFPYNPTYYGREYRRPRRIACTCPNCRDGENKTITTRDGKQKKQHICHVPGCGKIYGKTSHLRAHLRWHAGERPFACNWLFCNKRFTRSDELQRHRRTHTGDKRFECTICLKKFMRSDHLSKHMKTHQAPNAKNKDKGDSKTSGDQVKTGVNKTTPNKQDTNIQTTLSKTNSTETFAL